MKKETIQELEAKLAEAKKEQADEEKQERKKYIANRDATVINLCTQAKELNHILTNLSVLAHAAMRQQKQKLSEYGRLRKNSKGGFELKTEDGLFKIRYGYTSIPTYDERATKAEDLLKEFLKTTIKQKDLGAYEIIMSLLERNKAGQLEFSRISKLYQLEDRYTDERWLEAIKLFKESFRVTGSKMQLAFYQLNAKNEYELINLNFSSL
jgi:uncharacterized protein DUF3164